MHFLSRTHCEIRLHRLIGQPRHEQGLYLVLVPFPFHVKRPELVTDLLGQRFSLSEADTGCTAAQVDRLCTDLEEWGMDRNQFGNLARLLAEGLISVVLRGGECHG